MSVNVLKLVTGWQLTHINWDAWKTGLCVSHGCDFVMYRYDCMKLYSMGTVTFVKCDYESGATD